MKHLYRPSYDYTCRALIRKRFCGKGILDEVHNIPQQFTPAHSNTCRQCCEHCSNIEKSDIHNIKGTDSE